MTWLYITLGSVLGVVAIVVAIIIFIPRYREHKLDEADMWLINEFQRCNVMVFGKKRQGKDLIFAHVMALRGDKHYANITYDENTEVITLKELNVGDNTFVDLINGTVRRFPPRFEEGCDIYISDCGIYLPSHYDKELDRLFPGMPVFFALSGQLYNLNVHINSQAVGRPWKKLREQADSYIQVKRSVLHGDCFYVYIIGYEKITEAENETNPIVKYTVRVPLSELKYDTRYFRQFLLDSPPKVRTKILSKILRS